MLDYHAIIHIEDPLANTLAYSLLRIKLSKGKLMFMLPLLYTVSVVEHRCR